MTNYEAIKMMDKEELARFMSDVTACGNCPVSDRACDAMGTCSGAILNWLDKDSGDDTVVDHTSGDVIHISHAHVVIIQ